MSKYERLRIFAGKVLHQSREHLGDVDGGDIQDWAVEAGLLVAEERTEPCGEDCLCEWPGTCYFYSEFGKRCVKEAGK